MSTQEHQSSCKEPLLPYLIIITVLVGSLLFLTSMRLNDTNILCQHILDGQRDQTTVLVQIRDILVLMGNMTL
jgi:hypothetical protein